MFSPPQTSSAFLFVTGGVLSSLGKGFTAAALGALLVARGLKVTMLKIDPYFNIDPGTMSPREHGEVFVTNDGKETDLDLGHYERFAGIRMTRDNTFSAGVIYDAILRKERKGGYLGQTVQVIPHIADEIKARIYRVGQTYDVTIVEIGGTVGDIESLPFLEAIRQMRLELQPQQTIFLHLTWVPFLEHTSESKTKPSQHSVREMRAIGLQPDILVCRANQSLDNEALKKIALHTNVSKESVIPLENLSNAYALPLILHQRQLDQAVLRALGMEERCIPIDLHDWEWAAEISQRRDKPVVRVAMVGKYGRSRDTYKSLVAALEHAAIQNACALVIDYIDAEQLDKNREKSWKKLQQANNLLIPGGFGKNGAEGKIRAIMHARTQRMPFLGICLGMQFAIIEYARNVLKLSHAHSTEMDAHTQDPVIALVTEWIQQSGTIEMRDANTQKGGTMRLGAYPCHLQLHSKAHAIYQQELIYERHRHRYEFNPRYRDAFVNAGMRFTGVSGDEQKLIEIIELPQEVHPWFIACQYHPEFTSQPLLGHPLFNSFIAAGLQYGIQAAR